MQTSGGNEDDTNKEIRTGGGEDVLPKRMQSESSPIKILVKSHTPHTQTVFLHEY